MYKIQGADQKEYGPITADQIRSWITENRLNRFSLCAGADGVWKPLGQFLEFKDYLAASASGAAASSGAGGSSGGGPGNYSSGSGGGQGEALRKVQAPAICLMVLGAVSVLMAIVGPFTKKAQLNMLPQLVPNLPPEFRQALLQRANAGFGVVDVFSLLFALAISGVVLYGASQMKQLRGFGWSTAACILAILPCTACCCVGIPLGVWGLLTINARDVKPNFTN